MFEFEWEQPIRGRTESITLQTVGGIHAGDRSQWRTRAGRTVSNQSSCHCIGYCSTGPTGRDIIPGRGHSRID